MADDHSSDQPQSAETQPPVSQRHDKYFYRVFSDTEDAAGLLRSCLPQELARTLRWSTLARQPSRFVSDDWRGREADLLFSVEREGSGPPVLVYVLLEHQSTPDRWMRLRLLNYCLMAWMQWHREHEQETQLPLIVPVVFYQGAEPWRFSRQFAELVAGAESAPGWVPQFEHLLIDQTEQNPESVAGTLSARLAQLALMAEYRRDDWEGWEELLNQVIQLVDKLYPDAGIDRVSLHVEYVLLTLKSNEQQQAFEEALRRTVPGRGGEVMTYVHKMIDDGRREGEMKGRREGRQEGRREGRQEGRREGRQEGELRGQLQTIQGFLGRDVPWSTIEAATGIDEATFRRLKQQFDDNGAGHAE